MNTNGLSFPSYHSKKAACGPYPEFPGPYKFLILESNDFHVALSRFSLSLHLDSVSLKNVVGTVVNVWGSGNAA